MKKIVTICATTMLIGAGALASANPALADIPSNQVVDGMACQWVDTRAPVGTQIVYSLGSDCTSSNYTIRGGSPTVTTDGGRHPMFWRQEVELLPGATCEEGWGPSWAQWANGGSGGPICGRDVMWGNPEYVNPSITVTINTDDDWVEVASADQWAVGCDVDPDQDFYADLQQVGCPPA